MEPDRCGRLCSPSSGGSSVCNACSIRSSLNMRSVRGTVEVAACADLLDHRRQVAWLWSERAVP
eukprot:9774177-Alexandrium_andersonii.AAC.1